MKPKNFPARKLARQQRAQGVYNEQALIEARDIRTKKDRTGKGRV